MYLRDDDDDVSNKTSRGAVPGNNPEGLRVLEKDGQEGCKLLGLLDGTPLTSCVDGFELGWQPGFEDGIFGWHEGL